MTSELITFSNVPHSEICSICRKDFQEEDKAIGHHPQKNKTISHIFHENCINKSLKSYGWYCACCQEPLNNKRNVITLYNVLNSNNSLIKSLKSMLLFTFLLVCFFVALWGEYYSDSDCNNPF